MHSATSSLRSLSSTRLVVAEISSPKLISRCAALKTAQFLPYAIMGMLVIYCLRGISFTAAANFLPELIACAVVVLAHVWKRNTLLSIISGTVCYMLLVQFVF